MLIQHLKVIQHFKFYHGGMEKTERDNIKRKLLSTLPCFI